MDVTGGFAWSDIHTWIAIGQIILVDIVLAGDNAVVIGMAAGKLEPHLQKKAILWGTAGAIALRMILAFVLVEALTRIPALHIVGGLILLWIAVELLCDDKGKKSVEEKDSLKGAITTIIMADAMMSVDNVLGVVAASGGHFGLVVAGMMITVPIIIFSSTFFARLIRKYPIVLYIGGGILGWVAGGMIIADGFVSPYVIGYETAIKAACVAGVISVAEILKRRS